MELVLYATSQYPFIYGYSGLWQACQMPNLCGQSEQEAAVLQQTQLQCQNLLILKSGKSQFVIFGTLNQRSF